MDFNRVFGTWLETRFLPFLAVAEALVGFDLYGGLISPYHIAKVGTNMGACPIQSFLLVRLAN